MLTIVEFNEIVDKLSTINDTSSFINFIKGFANEKDDHFFLEKKYIADRYVGFAVLNHSSVRIGSLHVGLDVDYITTNLHVFTEIPVFYNDVWQSSMELSNNSNPIVIRRVDRGKRIEGYASYTLFFNEVSNFEKIGSDIYQKMNQSYDELLTYSVMNI